MSRTVTLSDSVVWRSLSRQELGCPVPAQQGRPPPGTQPHRPPPGAAGRPGTGCSQPTSPSCQRAGRSELMAVPVSQVLQFLSPRVPVVAAPAPPPRDSSAPPCSFESSGGHDFNCPSDTAPSGNLIFVDLCALLSRLGEACTLPAPAGMRLRRRRGGQPSWPEGTGFVWTAPEP